MNTINYWIFRYKKDISIESPILKPRKAVGKLVDGVKVGVILFQFAGKESIFHKHI